ncbi:hypothetical protein FGG08_004914 [Glutinoglossum americanum]|uniref:Uncharacterized protein n=1 Tax=Glutinoglossum americanum TaxID=1670608 RepID=A0A9P8I4D0_9PEZI|nr:hypothetical protein FGG08_004914 [Glutinoglossum americanum]
MAESTDQMVIEDPSAAESSTAQNNVGSSQPSDTIGSLAGRRRALEEERATLIERIRWTADEEVDLEDMRPPAQRQKVSELAYRFKIEKPEDYDSGNQHILQDPVTRAAMQSHRYDRAQQRPNQTVKQFVSYMDDLEADLLPYSDEHRRQHLFAKLKPELRRALANYQEVPTTRQGLINLATQLEANLRDDPNTADRATRREDDGKTHRKQRSDRSEKRDRRQNKGKERDQSPKEKRRDGDTLTPEERD